MANPVSPVGGTLTPDDPATLSAIRRYEERLARDPTSLAFAALADAVSHLEHAVRLDPGDRESRALLDVLGAGGSVSDNSALKQLLADDTFVTMSFGRVCLEQGLVDEAAHRLKTQRRKGL